MVSHKRNLKQANELWKGECLMLSLKTRNTIIRHRNRVTDIVHYVTTRKWKWVGHIARMKDNTSRWTIRSTEWQIQGVTSVGRPTRLWRGDTVWQQGAVGTRIAKDRERLRTLAGGGLLPAVEGHSLEQNRIDC